MPDIIKLFVDQSKIPHFISDNQWGHRFWGAIFSVIETSNQAYSSWCSSRCPSQEK